MNEQEKSSAVWAGLSSKDPAVIARLRAVGYWENRQREQELKQLAEFDHQAAREIFTPQDVKMMSYALAYIKKAGIAQFEKELDQIKQAVQTENHSLV